MISADIRKAMYKSVEIEVPANVNILAKIESKGYYIFTLTSELDNIVVEIRDGSITKYTSKRSIEGGYIELSKEFYEVDENDAQVFYKLFGVEGLPRINDLGLDINVKMYSEIKYGYIASFFPSEAMTVETKLSIKEGMCIPDRIRIGNENKESQVKLYGNLDLLSINDYTGVLNANKIFTKTIGNYEDRDEVTSPSRAAIELGTASINIGASLSYPYKNEIKINSDGININANGDDGFTLNSKSIRLKGRTLLEQAILYESYSNNGTQYNATTTLTPGHIIMETNDSTRSKIELNGIDNEKEFKTVVSNGLSGTVLPGCPFQIGVHSSGSWDYNAFRLFSDRGISLGVIDNSGIFKEQLAIGSYDPSSQDTINIASRHIQLRRLNAPVSIDTAIGTNNNIYIANSNDKFALTDFIYKNNILFTDFNTGRSYYSILSAYNNKKRILFDNLENINDSVYAITPYDIISSGKTSFFPIRSVHQIEANTEFKVTTETTASVTASSTYFKNRKARLYFRALDYNSIDELDELLDNMIDYIANAECSPASKCDKYNTIFSSGNRKIMEKLLVSAHTLNTGSHYIEMDPDNDSNYIYSVDCDVRSVRVEFNSQLTTSVDHYITVPISINTQNSYIFVVKEINTINSIINNYFSTSGNAAVNYISYDCPMLVIRGEFSGR